MLNGIRSRGQDRALFDSRFAYHLRCLREGATDPDMTSLERLALVRERVGRMREDEQELAAMKRAGPAGGKND